MHWEIFGTDEMISANVDLGNDFLTVAKEFEFSEQRRWHTAYTTFIHPLTTSNTAKLNDTRSKYYER